jgi:hypothetical protein
MSNIQAIEVSQNSGSAKDKMGTIFSANRARSGIWRQTSYSSCHFYFRSLAPNHLFFLSFLFSLPPKRPVYSNCPFSLCLNQSCPGDSSKQYGAAQNRALKPACSFSFPRVEQQGSRNECGKVGTNKDCGQECAVTNRKRNAMAELDSNGNSGKEMASANLP